MDNNVNLVASRKKKNKRKRKNAFARRSLQQPQDTNPAATLQRLKTIANLFHIHQQLALSGTNYVSDNPKPLMSTPRLTRPMFSGRKLPGFLEPEPKTNLFPSTELKNTNIEKTKSTPDIDENQLNNSPMQKDTSVEIKTEISNSQDCQSQNTTMNSNNVIFESVLNNFQTTEKQSSRNESNQTAYNRNISYSNDLKKEQMETKTFRKYSRAKDNQFDDFEIHNNPSFMSFETTEEVVDLNDDDLILNHSINDTKQNDNHNKDYSLQRNIQSNFQIKLQEQYAKKLEIQNKSQPKTSPVHDRPEKPLLSGQDEAKKKANRELLEGLHSDIKTVVQDNIKSDIQWDNVGTNFNTPQVTKRLPAGIPRSFLLMDKYTEPQQITYSENPSTSNTPRSFDWTLNMTLQNAQKLIQNQIISQPQIYSPSDVYQEAKNKEDSQDGSGSPDVLDPSNKRVSAFQRLGPLSQPKKPKLTINLCLNKEQTVREVIDETYKDLPVNEREDILNSRDDIVVKYLPFWPWNKPVAVKKSVTARYSKTVMMMEKEQMEEIYTKDNSLIMLSVTGYPSSWTKENLLDVILENLKGKSFIPTFIEFTAKECKFFVFRCSGALVLIHWLGFMIKKDDVEISITISQTQLTNKHIDFVPRLVLSKRLMSLYDGEKIDLSEFTLKKDISHFIYFPLNHIHNQSEIIQMQSDVTWEHLTELDLSSNRITSIEGFNLANVTPRLKVLNLSRNYLESVLVLLPCKHLPLKKLMLEGNPLCMNYIEPDHYVNVIRMMFPGLRELDGVEITLKGDLPKPLQNYCPEDARPIVEKFLEVFFPLLDLENDDRQCIQDMYMKNAVMTITCRSRLRYDSAYKHMRNFSIKSQNFLERNIDKVEGVTNIGKLIRKWPNTQHDPTTFTTDVLYHDDSSTIFKIAGILKVTAESLAEEEPLMAFSRTIVLHTENGCHYKIRNELVYWDEPTVEYSSNAFKSVMVPRKTLNLRFETVPDDYIKKQLIAIFMMLTELEAKPSERCLELKNWHFQHALEYFIKLEKLDNTQILHD